MAQIGFTLSSEEHPPPVLLRQAGAAERSGFDFLTISDHYHPWIDRQGNAPFVWAVIGGISQVTERIELITAVTCPSQRIHPAIIAQAAATAASMLPESAFPLPAISSAVPWSTDVRMMGMPSVTFTAWPNPLCLSTGRPWS